MSYACHGLFFREGMVLAEEATKNLALGEDPLEFGRKVSQETFSIIGPAIVGAGMTAATELGHTAPHRVLLESDDATVVIQEIGRRAMVVLVVPPERVVSDLDAAISRFAQAAAKDLD